MWRFPYLVQKYGGGSFIIPFLVMMFIEAMPLLLIELGLGQKFRSGSVGIWRKLHPYFQGERCLSDIIKTIKSLVYGIVIVGKVKCLFSNNP